MFNRIRSIMSSGSIFGYFLQVVPVTLAAGVVYAVIRAVTIKRKKLPFERAKEITRMLFTCYLTGLFSLVVLPANFWLYFFDCVFLGYRDGMPPFFGFGGFSFVPSFARVLSGDLVLSGWVKTMLIGNIAMFLPLGFFLPFVTKKVNGKNIFAAAVAVPLGAELLQMIFGRCFDVDDLICNFIGIVTGFFAAVTIRAVGKKRRGKTGEKA